MKVLNFGSLNIDYVYQVPHFVKEGETLASTGLCVFSGGKGLNQSVALARAGAQVFHAGNIGEDGVFLLDELNDAGVNTSLVCVHSDIKTGHAVIQNDPSGNNCILLYGGANQSVTPAQIESVFASFGKDDLLVLQNEINDLLLIIAESKRKGMTLCLNPSPMSENLYPLIPKADYLLLNEVEAAQYLDHADASSLEGGLETGLSEALPQVKIVLTLGENGCVWIHGDEIIRQEAFKANAVDTTAAGDTFTGFFLAGIMDGKPTEEALRYASFAAALAVTRPGASPSIPTKAEVDAGLKHTRP
ncbi:MAG: ribokinase [Clostridiales bacterium]|nr:ribokinase [Clostridiales bacterium]